MLAQVSLTPAESKKLIATAVAEMDIVKRANDEGTLAMHPSSSTYFLVEALTGARPPTNVWVCGVIVPRGACMEMGAALAPRPPGEGGPGKRSPGGFSRSWVVSKGKLSTGLTLDTLIERMGPGDAYIKGVNAIDPQGNVGVLWGNAAEGGTAGLMAASARRKGFTLVFPVGLEKLIPVPIAEAAKTARRHGYDYAMGIPCGLLPMNGEVVTELRAIQVLSGAAAVPIAAGGLGGAEGAVTLVIKGEKDQVSKAIDHIERCKGAKLPQVRSAVCSECTVPICDFPLRDKPWV